VKLTFYYALSEELIIHEYTPKFETAFECRLEWDPMAKTIISKSGSCEQMEVSKWYDAPDWSKSGREIL